MMMNHEKKRLDTLLNCFILDTDSERKYDDITILAATIADVPIALISLIDQDRQWFKSKVGLSVSQTARNISFCDHAIRIPTEPLIVENALEDPRFCDTPLVTSDPNIRFYAGFPLLVSGYALGTLCVIDDKPRQLSQIQINSLQTLSHNVANMIEGDKLALEKHNMHIAMHEALKGIAELDAQGNVLSVNEKMLRKVGATEESFLGKHVSESVAIDQKEAFNSLLSEAIISGRAEKEFCLSHKQAEARYVNIVIVPKVTFKKNLVGYYCFVQNITHRKTIESKLQETQNFQELILENMPDYVFVKDQNFNIILANSMFLGLYPEEKRESIIGTTTFEAYDPDIADQFLIEDRKAFKEGFSEVIETAHFPNGEKRTFLTKKLVFKNMDDVPFILCIAQDVTEREGLIQRLKESNQALDEFAYITSHDLKEPIRGINNHLHKLKKILSQDVSSKVLHSIDRIENLTAYTENLVSDLLNYSRLAHIDFAFQHIDLKAMLQDIIPILQECFSKKINVTIHELPHIYCDHIRFKEVLRNLLTNAIKYNDKEEVHIEIGSIDHHPHMHRIYIKDNGIGIAPKHQDFIFRIFRRLHRKDEYGGGMGTGLAFVKKIVERHQGAICVDSVKGEYTIFYIDLPHKKIDFLKLEAA